MTDVQQWLNSIGLGQYADAFEENAIEWDLLPGLSSEELKEIGVGPLGHRKRILDAVGTLAARAAPAQSSIPGGEAERRQLTVMFCDLVGSVALGERMDVEDYRDLLARFRNAVGPLWAADSTGRCNTRTKPTSAGVTNPRVKPIRD